MGTRAERKTFRIEFDVIFDPDEVTHGNIVTHISEHLCSLWPTLAMNDIAVSVNEAGAVEVYISIFKKPVFKH